MCMYSSLCRKLASKLSPNSLAGMVKNSCERRFGGSSSSRIFDADRRSEIQWCVWERYWQINWYRRCNASCTGIERYSSMCVREITPPPRGYTRSTAKRGKVEIHALTLLSFFPRCFREGRERYYQCTGGKRGGSCHSNLPPTANCPRILWGQIRPAANVPN